jgi:formamidopyrimidine-DNA glycosylase
LRAILKGRKTNIKALLLNQQLIAGIGNIYADEILFESGVLPARPADKLSAGEIKAIAESIPNILKKAIKYRGTTFNDYRDANGKHGSFLKMLKVYRRDGEKCLRCGKGVIDKAKVAGRGTHFCPVCQK